MDARGPEVVSFHADLPEVAPSYSTKAYVHPQTTAYTPRAEAVLPSLVDHQTPSFVRGLLLGLLIATIVIGATLGGGIGASLSSCQKDVKDLEMSQSASSTVLPASTSALPSSSPSASSTASAQNYTVPGPQTIDTLRNDCSSDTAPTNAFQDVFSSACGQDYHSSLEAAGGGVVADLVRILAYTFLDCLNACSSLNARADLWNFTERCRAVTWNVAMKNTTADGQGNCWLKNATLANPADAVSNPDTMSAELLSAAS